MKSGPNPVSIEHLRAPYPRSCQEMQVRQIQFILIDDNKLIKRYSFGKNIIMF